jgi:YGGT family
LEEPESEWIVREERVATQPPDFPQKLVADNPADTSQSSAIVQTTDVDRGPILPGESSNGHGKVSSAQSVVRRVPAYDYRMVRVVRYATAVLEVALVIRFFLRLLGASPDAAFTVLIYGLTYPFLVPFEGVFGQPGQGAFVFDSAALVAMIVYPLVGWAAVGLIKIKTTRLNPWNDAGQR